MIFSIQVVDWQQSVLDNSQPVSNQVWKHTLKMLELLDQNDISATFFVQNKVAIKYPVLVRKIVAAGHEIACYFDQPYQKHRFMETARQAVSQLEDISGIKVTGTRSQCLDPLHTNFDHYCNSLKLQGIQYDSSLITPLSMTELEQRNPSIGAFKAYELSQFTLPVLLKLPFLPKQALPFGGSSFRLLPYELSYTLAKKLDRENAIFQLPVYDLGSNEYTAMTSLYRLPLQRKLDFYGRQSVPDKLYKLFRDFPFDNFKNICEAPGACRT